MRSAPHTPAPPSAASTPAEAAGHEALTAAGGRDNGDRPEEILAAALVPAPRQNGHRSVERWESDGGRVRRTD